MFRDCYYDNSTTCPRCARMTDRQQDEVEEDKWAWLQEEVFYNMFITLSRAKLASRLGIMFDLFCFIFVFISSVHYSVKQGTKTFKTWCTERSCVSEVIQCSCLNICEHGSWCKITIQFPLEQFLDISPRWCQKKLCISLLASKRMSFNEMFWCIKSKFPAFNYKMEKC